MDGDWLTSTAMDNKEIQRWPRRKDCNSIQEEEGGRGLEWRDVRILGLVFFFGVILGLAICFLFLLFFFLLLFGLSSECSTSSCSLLFPFLEQKRRNRGHKATQDGGERGDRQFSHLRRAHSTWRRSAFQARQKLPLGCLF
jgi:hypothetical protein